MTRCRMKILFLLIANLASMIMHAGSVNLNSTNNLPGNTSIVMITDEGLGEPAQHGLNKLEDAIRSTGMVLKLSEIVDPESTDFFILAGITGNSG